MTLSEVTKALEAAVADVTAKQNAAAIAKASFDAANAAYAASRGKVKDLHEEYSKQMSAILTGFGQLHK